MASSGSSAPTWRPTHTGTDPTTIQIARASSSSTGANWIDLRAAVEQRGLTLVPLRLHLKQGLAKVDIGVARGKKLYDKRAAEAERQSRRDVDRAMRERG